MQNSTSTSSTFERPADLWLDDGNIVLQVEGTQFCLHRSMLCSNSSVFNDMFGLPQPSSLPIVEGRPLVHCMGDAAQDWKNMLTAIYYPFKFKKLYRSVAFLASILRVGSKYQFDSIRDDALDQIKTHLPRTIYDWDEANRKYITVPLWLENQEFDLINIALTLGIQSILPALYYVCASIMDTDQIFGGQRRADGTISRLTPASQHIILAGQSKLRELTPSQTLEWLFSDILPANDCLSHAECYKARIASMQAEIPTLVLNPVFALDQYKYLESCPVFCHVCHSHANDLHDQGRLNIWTELPLLFGLPKWDSIKDFVD